MKRPLIFKELEKKRNFSDNHRKNISRLFQILAKLLFPTSTQYSVVVLSQPRKSQFLAVVLQECQKLAVNDSIEKSTLHSFVDLCPRLPEETYFYI